MKVINMDEAKRLGLWKYRELYPVGKIPDGVEKHANLSVLPSAEFYSFIITYSLRNRVDPYVLFRAAINKYSGEVRVLESAPSSPINSIEDLDLTSQATLRERSGDAS
jgi:hypothetical protein